MTKKERRKEDFKKIITLMIIGLIVVIIFSSDYFEDYGFHFSVSAEEVFVFVICFLLIFAGSIMIIGFMKIGVMLFKLAIIAVIIVSILTFILR